MSSNRSFVRIFARLRWRLKISIIAILLKPAFRRLQRMEEALPLTVQGELDHAKAQRREGEERITGIPSRLCAFACLIHQFDWR